MIRQNSFLEDRPTLYLVATPIGNASEITQRALQVLSSVDVVAAEDTRNTGALFKRYGIKAKYIAYHAFNERESAEGILHLLRQGKSVAIVTDAGYPLVSDPGQTIVSRAVEERIPVVAVNGPSACLCALVASGLSVQPFSFYGFLSAKAAERKKKLKQLQDREETLVFYEAPHRIEGMLKDVQEILGDRRICVAREMTKIHEEYIRGRVSEVLPIASSLKGEMAVVVEGCRRKEEASLSLSELTKAVDERIAEGMSTSEAIRKTAEEYGIPKNEVYRRYFSC